MRRGHGKAVDWLRQKGLSKAAKKAGRATSEGLVGFELAADGKSGVAVEVKCETDFVARGDKFQGFVKDMVAQVAKGEYADSEALLAAPFVADASVTVKEALDGVIATTGENMGLGKFAKMELAAGKSGLIGGYLHSNGKLAVLVEMQTGSDAAAASEAFHEVAKNVAMQIAAASPLAVSAEGLNPEVVEHEREVYRQKAREEGKPEQIIEKIAEGAGQEVLQGRVPARPALYPRRQDDDQRSHQGRRQDHRRADHRGPLRADSARRRIVYATDCKGGPCPFFVIATAGSDNESLFRRACAHHGRVGVHRLQSWHPPS